MKTPVRYSRGRIEYTGRLAYKSFTAWIASPRGRAVIEGMAARARFALFGKVRAARRRLWREVSDAAAAATTAASVQREVDAALAHLETLVYARDLPQLAVDLRRLVVVPRFFVNANLYPRLEAALDHVPQFAAVEGGEPLRDWFMLSIIAAFETAVTRARPSPKHPLSAGNGWIAVGVNDGFQWRVPIDGPSWPGHYYVLELTNAPITRAVRKNTTEAMLRMERRLLTLPRSDRGEILRQAGLSMQLIRA